MDRVWFMNQVSVFSRIQLEKMYEMMGGNDLHENAQTILNELQNKLINRLDQLAAIFGESFLPRITEGKITKIWLPNTIIINLILIKA